MYDIYLYNGGLKIPKWEDLVQEVPMLADPVFQKSFLTSLPSHSGFLGVDLPERSAKKLFLCLRTVGARGELVPVSYRQPQINKEQALSIAEQASVEVHANRFADRALGSVYFRGEYPMYWGFSAILQPHVEVEGGGIHVSVDKLDGHVWTREEFLQREKEREDLEEELRWLVKKEQ